MHEAITTGANLLLTLEDSFIYLVINVTIHMQSTESLIERHKVPACHEHVTRRNNRISVSNFGSAQNVTTLFRTTQARQVTPKCATLSKNCVAAASARPSFYPRAFPRIAISTALRNIDHTNVTMGRHRLKAPRNQASCIIT